MALGRMAGERLSLLSLLSLSGLSLLSLSIVSLSDPLPLSEGPLGEREEGVCGRLPEGREGGEGAPRHPSFPVRPPPELEWMKPITHEK